MDIMMPDIQEQPAPAPWLALRERVNGRRLVDEIVGISQTQYSKMWLRNCVGAIV